MAGDLFDLELLDDEEPFEIGQQVAHLFKHPNLESMTSPTSGRVTRSSIRPSRLLTG